MFKKYNIVISLILMLGFIFTFVGLWNLLIEPWEGERFYNDISNIPNISQNNQQITIGSRVIFEGTVQSLTTTLSINMSDNSKIAVLNTDYICPCPTEINRTIECPRKPKTEDKMIVIGVIRSWGDNKTIYAECIHLGSYKGYIEDISLYSGLSSSFGRIFGAFISALGIIIILSVRLRNKW